MGRRVVAAACMAVMALGPLSLSAATAFRITGVVTGLETGDPMRGAVVTLISDERTMQRRTDQQGYFSFLGSATETRTVLLILMPGKLPCRIVDAALQANDVHITARLVGHLTEMNAPPCYFRVSPNPQAFDQYVISKP